MALNYIWVAFFVVAFAVAAVKLLFLGQTDIFTQVVNATFDSSKNAFEISLGLTGDGSARCSVGCFPTFPPDIPPSAPSS